MAQQTNRELIEEGLSKYVDANGNPVSGASTPATKLVEFDKTLKEKLQNGKDLLQKGGKKIKDMITGDDVKKGLTDGTTNK